MEQDAPPHRRWADLDAGVLSRIAYCFDFRDYAFFRVVCTSWRSALPPPDSRPFARVFPAPGDSNSTDAAGHQPVSFAAWCLLSRERCRLAGLRQPSRLAPISRCIGARDGWVALALGTAGPGAGGLKVSLFNPVTGAEIPLDASLCDLRLGGVYEHWAPKVVFAPSPSACDFTAVGICGPKRLAVQRSCGDGKGGYISQAIDTDDDFMDGAFLADIAYRDDGDTVYCLTSRGGVHVLRLNRRRRRGCSARAVEVRPLMGKGNDVFFPPPYDTISRHTDAKNLVLCDGVLYQIWRRPRGAGSVDVPAEDGAWPRKAIRIQEGDVFVRRYDPGRWPYWAEAQDLGGNAVFVGMNDAAAVRGGDGATALRGNCVYYWDRRAGGDYEAVVFDMATGSSARWLPANEAVSSPLWYFLPAGRRHVEPTTEEDTGLEVPCPDNITV